MKKHLFFIASVFAAVSLQAQTPTVKVAANTNVKVKPGTLFYVNGDISLDNYTESSKKFSNEGNVKITQALINNDNTGSNFVNELVSTGNYGQLIISNGTDVNRGKITSILKFKSGFNYYPISIPYKIEAQSIVNDLFGIVDQSKAFGGYTPGVDGWDSNRVVNNVLFVWDNDKYQYTQLKSDYKFGEENSRGRYYVINNNKDYSVGGLVLNIPKSIKGTPVKEKFSVTLQRYNKLENKYKRDGDIDATILDNTNIGVNEYGEAYGSYIIDFVEEMPDDWGIYRDRKDNGVKTTDFGLRVYNLGNPYTSNINLAKSNKNSDFWLNLKALVQYTHQDYDVKINSGEVSGSYGGSFSAMTGQGAGDQNLGFIAPFQTFAVKMKSSMPDNVSFTFDDDMKTFDKPTTGPLVNSVFAKYITYNRSILKQVGLDLYDDKDNFTGVKTYVVASNIYEALPVDGEGQEIYNHSLDDDVTGVYTLQENENGEVNEAYAKHKTYINGVNESKYIAKPIHLVFQNGKGQYTLKARLNENLENNKNSFYFEDKVTGKVMKVTKNFSYTFDISGTDKDRFVLYWAATPNVVKEREVANESVDTTVVFKDLDTYKVKFDKSINSADIFVYNISGQLVNMDRNVDASLDYIVPLKNNSSVYIIKIIGDNGKVITKKIIK